MKNQVIELKGRQVLEILNDGLISNRHRIVREGGNGCYILAEKPYTLHGDDNYLVYVLAFYETQYVTWYENVETGGFYGGHYYGADFAAAFIDFTERGTYVDYSNYPAERVGLEVKVKRVIS